MELRLLKTFLLVARLMNITQAAERLNFTQPAITAQIHNLESALGARLFTRKGKRLLLTEAGLRLVAHAESILLQWEQAKEELAVYAENRESLVLGVSTQLINYFLPDVLRRLQEKMPQLIVSVEVCSNTKTVLQGVEDGQFDLGLIHGRNYLRRLKEHAVWEEDILWVIGQNCSWENGDVLPLVNFKQGSDFRAQWELARGSQPYHTVAEYSDSEAVKRAVLNGLGAAYLPKTLVQEELQQGKLRLAEGPALQMKIFLVHRIRQTFTAAMQALLWQLSENSAAEESLLTLLGEMDAYKNK
ncbi:MAG: LysR family transcriptional regulator [Anaeromusa sp.]|uniref:LysR family transcriptional regulator n=1 Tax=Anaeromusa sp. TaxID=1872520 RepID=UPI002B2130CB|nr:LysR family transcriptional regulator [Anaeromusa sp.]MEA4834575.1 LysR family transcriptional regulator [Anaeromusa sp.]